MAGSDAYISKPISAPLEPLLVGLLVSKDETSARVVRAGAPAKGPRDSNRAARLLSFFAGHNTGLLQRHAQVRVVILFLIVAVAAIVAVTAQDPAPMA